MPGGDRTGPRGSGPMTGRGMGYCVGYVRPGFINPRFGPRFSRGRGFGRGLRIRRRFPRNVDYDIYYEEPRVLTKEQEKSFLEEEVTGLEAELGRIKQRIKSLESKE